METIFLFDAIKRKSHHSYPSGHSWYYKYNKPKQVETILRENSKKEILVSIPKNNKTKFLEIADKVYTDLENAIIRYLEVIARYTPMPWESTPSEIECGRNTALSLTHNHICYYSAQLNFMLRMARKMKIELKVK